VSFGSLSRRHLIGAYYGAHADPLYTARCVSFGLLAYWYDGILRLRMHIFNITSSSLGAVILNSRPSFSLGGSLFYSTRASAGSLAILRLHAHRSFALTVLARRSLFYSLANECRWAGLNHSLKEDGKMDRRTIVDNRQIAVSDPP
jgi:hypothetical protein